MTSQPAAGSSMTDEILAQLSMPDLAARLGTDEATARAAAEDALPALLAGLTSEAVDPSRRTELARAVRDDHDPQVLDRDDPVAHVDAEEGDRIVQHVFGDQRGEVEQQLQSASGQGSLMEQLLPILAPVVMAWLSRKMLGGSSGTGGAGEAGGGLGDILGDLLGREAGGTSGSSGGSTSGGGLGDVLGDVLGGGGGGGLGEVLGDVLGGGSSRAGRADGTDRGSDTGLGGMLGEALGGDADRDGDSRATTTGRTGGGLGEVLGQLGGKAGRGGGLDDLLGGILGGDRRR